MLFTPITAEVNMDPVSDMEYPLLKELLYLILIFTFVSESGVLWFKRKGSTTMAVQQNCYDTNI